MRKLVVSAIIVLILAGLFFSCQPEISPVSPTTDEAIGEYDNEFLKAIIVGMGFREDMIDDYGDFFLVEGDISFDKADLVKRVDSRQAQTTYLVSDPTDVTVRIDSSIPTSGIDNWRTEIAQSIGDWNSINSSCINLRLITTGTADITIRSDSGVLADYVIAAAEFPSSSGAPGYRIRINLNFFNDLNVSTGQKRFNMVHELGHCIGLRHTNWSALGESAAIHINGTPSTDANSVMNGGIALNSWVGFSDPDEIAISLLYPLDWHGWYNMGGYGTSAPAVCSWSSGRLDLFVRGPSNHLYHKWYNGSWHGWEDLGGILYSAPAAVSWGSGRIDVFVKGPYNHLWHKWYSGGWSGWEDLGGIIQSAPAVCSWASGRLDVFVKGNDSAVYQLYYSNGWHGWYNLGGVITAAPAAVSWGYGRIDLFVRGTNNTLWHKWYSGSWSGWENLGGALASGTGPAACSRGNNRLDVFVRGTDYGLWHKQWTGFGWTNYRSLGGNLWDQPTAVSWNSSRIDVFTLGSGNNVYQLFYQE